MLGDHIKVSELFYSIQGEGRYMGVPSVFLRTFGCNFKCAGFGMKPGALSTERNYIKAELYKNYKDLPLVTTGCDSYASWDPRFKHLSPSLDIDTIINRIIDLLPHKEWREEHLVITGGEPLLGWQKSYPTLLNHNKMLSLKELTFETNGTQTLTEELVNYLHDWQLDNGKKHREVTFSVSAKLPNSGEKWEDAIKPVVIKQYQEVGYTYLKFVVATEEDIEFAEKADRIYRDNGFVGPTYIMPVGGVESIYNLNNKNVALAAMKRGWRYSDRLQVPLFKNAWNT